MSVGTNYLSGPPNRGSSVSAAGQRCGLHGSEEPNMSEVEIQLSPAARSVAGALTEVDTITVVALAATTGAGKSTVAKALTLLERSRLAHRTVRETDGIREADLWSPTTVLGDFLSSAATEDTGNEVATQSSTRVEDGETRPEDAVPNGDISEGEGAADQKGPGHLLNDRSAGAIHYALEKMVAAGQATRTSEKPKRYRRAGLSSSAR